MRQFPMRTATLTRECTCSYCCNEIKANETFVTILENAEMHASVCCFECLQKLIERSIELSQLK